MNPVVQIVMIVCGAIIAIFVAIIEEELNQRTESDGRRIPRTVAHCSPSAGIDIHTGVPLRSSHQLLAAAPERIDFNWKFPFAGN